MAHHLCAHKRLGTDLSVDGRKKKRSQFLLSSEESAHLKAMCAQFSCLFHDVISIINAQGSRNIKGGMCRDFSCPHGIKLHELLRTECSILNDTHEKAYYRSARYALQQKHYRAMKEIAEYYDSRHLINPFTMYWLANFGAPTRPATKVGKIVPYTLVPHRFFFLGETCYGVQSVIWGYNL